MNKVAQEKKALIVGSIAFDIIFSVNGDMRDELPLEGGKVRKVNITLIANKRNQYYGGTAANIAYGVSTLGSKCLMFSIVGEDFYKDYDKHLMKHGVEVRIKNAGKGSQTSHSYQISDKLHQQILVWQPNEYADLIEETALDSTIDNTDFENINVAIFSPGTTFSTLNHLNEFSKRKRNDAIAIFDPGQINNLFDKETFVQCLNLSDILISNDIEIAGIKNKLGLDIQQMIKFGPKYVIETKGGEGSIIHTIDTKVHIAAAKPKSVVETTGAGDAFRAGLIHGLLNGMVIEDSAKYGAVLGSFCVESFSGQNYSFTKDELQDRLDSLGILNIVM